MNNTIEELYSELNETIRNLLSLIKIEDYIEIRDIYRSPYKSPELQTIKYQICNCIIMGFYISAITLTNHLLEKFLKISLIYNDGKKDKGDLDKPFSLTQSIARSNKKYDDKILYDNIISAFEEKLIDETQKQTLIKMKDFFRNPYSHSDRGKMYGGSTVGITEVRGIEEVMKILEGKEEELPKKQEKLENLPFADFKFIHDFASDDCIPYLLELDKIIRCVEKILYPKTRE